MKVLYDLFPESPYLLPTAYQPLSDVAQVEKKMFGREGANLTLYSSNGDILESTDGAYEHYKSVYQARATFAQDASGSHYQAGVFYVWEACGLGFRKGGQILDNLSKFVGHTII